MKAYRGSRGIAVLFL